MGWFSNSTTIGTYSMCLYLCISMWLYGLFIILFVADALLADLSHLMMDCHCRCLDCYRYRVSCRGCGSPLVPTLVHHLCYPDGVAHCYYATMGCASGHTFAHSNTLLPAVSASDRQYVHTHIPIYYHSILYSLYSLIRIPSLLSTLVLHSPTCFILVCLLALFWLFNCIKL